MIEMTFKKKEVKAILRLLEKIAECDVEGINRGALELTIQQVEELLDHMKHNGRSIATVGLEVTKSDFEMIQKLFEGLAGGPDEPAKDIHDIIDDGGDGDGDEKEPVPKPKEEISSKKPPEILEAPVYKPEPAKVAGFNCIPGTEMAIRPSRFLRYLK